MAVQHRKQLSRLDIPSPLNLPQYPSFNGQRMFTPSPDPHQHSIPQTSIHPNFPTQTPLQGNFALGFGGGPPRSRHGHAASIAQFPGPMLNPPPSAGPHTPGFKPGGFMPMHQRLGSAAITGSPMKSRRTASISIGGPPKALLGGPQRKVSPLPGSKPTEAATPGPSTEVKPLTKKVNVNLPNETEPVTYDGVEYETPPWSRQPQVSPRNMDYEDHPFLETKSRQEYPPNDFCHLAPAAFDVFLPTQNAWDAYRMAVIDERLARVWPESSSSRFSDYDAMNVALPGSPPDSISTPADPGLLAFKLNKLQHATSTSPAPSWSHKGWAGYQDDSGLPAPPMVPAQQENTQLSPLHAPQAWAPNARSAFLNSGSGSESASSSRPLSRRDFQRGFGFDIPEEEEEEEPDQSFGISYAPKVYGDTLSQEANEGMQSDELDDGSRTAAPTRIHSRHVSKSLETHSTNQQPESIPESIPTNPPSSTWPASESNPDVASDWTGSEDGRSVNEPTDDDDDKSLGEFSNPSDEERAHQKRMHIRMTRLSRGTQEIPRKLPNFPVPPDTPGMVIPTGSSQLSSDQLSNPSDEEDEDGSHIRMPEHSIQAQALHPARFHEFSPQHDINTMSFDAYDESRPPSLRVTQPDEKYTHGREPSLNSQRREAYDALNPLAKPFVFEGGKWPSLEMGGAPQHQRQLSGGRILNASAQEFKPLSFALGIQNGSQAAAVPRLSNLERAQVDASLQNSLQNVTSSFSQRHVLPATIDMTGTEMPSLQPSINAPDTASKPSQRIETTTWNLAAKPFMPGNIQQAISLQQVAHATKSLLEEPVVDKIVSSLESPVKSKNVPPPLEIKNRGSEGMVPVSVFTSLHRSPSEQKFKATSAGALESRQAPHSRRQSLDDLHVAPISRKASNLHILEGTLSSRVPHNPNPPLHSPMTSEEAFSGPSPRSSSSSNGMSPFESGGKALAPSVHTLEQRLEDLLDDKIETLRRDLIDIVSTSTKNDPILQQAIARLGSINTAYESSTSSFALHDTITKSHDLLRGLILDQLHAVMADHRAQLDTVYPAVEEMFTRHMLATGAALADVIPRLDALSHSVQDSRRAEQDALVKTLGASLLNRLDQVQPPSLDIEALTTRLSSAVRPQIHELIDLASDKKETAALIVQQLTPLLQSVVEKMPQSLDVSMTAREISEAISIRSILKDSEVIDGLASAISGQLSAFIDGNHSAVVESLPTLIESCLKPETSQLADRIQGVSTSLKSQIVDILTEINQQSASHSTTSEQLASLIAQVDAVARHQETNTISDSVLAQAQRLDVLDTLVTEVRDGVSLQRRLELSINNLVGTQSQSLERIMDLSSSIQANANITTQAEEKLLAALEQSVNTMASRTPVTENPLFNHLQSQLGELQSKYQELERSREELIARALGSESRNSILEQKLVEANTELTAQKNELAASLRRAQDLDGALSKALERVKSVESNARGYEEKMARSEASNRELLLELNQTKSKVETLKMEAEWNISDKASLQRELKQISAERDRLVNQQAADVDLRKTKNDVETVLQMLHSRQDKDLQELQALRDSKKVLEGEHLALQKRLREQDGKLANVERASMTARQNLALAQQRASDWEKRAKEFEGQVDSCKSKAKQLEDDKNQLEAESASMRSQLEERDAQHKVYVDTLQEELTSMKRDLLQAKKDLYDAQKNPVTTWRSHVPNGMRSSSTSSAGTAHDQSKVIRTHQESVNNTSTWDSMHAPKNARRDTKPSKRSSQPPRELASSPTPSNVSNAPTLQEDGWWS